MKRALIWKCLLFYVFLSLIKFSNEEETTPQENSNQEIRPIKMKEKPRHEIDCQTLGFQETLLCSTCKDLKQFAPDEGLLRIENALKSDNIRFLKDLYQECLSCCAEE